jgi:hypothetical protein
LLGVSGRRLTPWPATASSRPRPLRCRRARFCGAALTPETNFLGYRRAACRIARRDQWIIPRQVPARAVSGNIKAVSDAQMAAENLCAKPALEANHVILLHRASDRHRWPRRLLHRWGATETGQCAMHLDDQCREVVGRDLVVSQIAANDLGDLMRIDALRWVFLCHRVLPDFLILARFIVLVASEQSYLMDLMFNHLAY